MVKGSRTGREKTLVHQRSTIRRSRSTMMNERASRRKTTSLWSSSRNTRGTRPERGDLYSSLRLSIAFLQPPVFATGSHILPDQVSEMGSGPLLKVKRW